MTSEMRAAGKPRCARDDSPAERRTCFVRFVFEATERGLHTRSAARRYKRRYGAWPTPEVLEGGTR